MLIHHADGHAHAMAMVPSIGERDVPIIIPKQGYMDARHITI